MLIRVENKCYCKSLYFSWSLGVCENKTKNMQVLYTQTKLTLKPIQLVGSGDSWGCYYSQCCPSNSSGSICFLYNQKDGKTRCFKTSGKLGLPAACAPSPGLGYCPMQPYPGVTVLPLCSCPYRQSCAWCACTCRVHRRRWQTLPRVSFANRRILLHAEQGCPSLLEILCTASLLSYHFLISNH